MDNTVVLEVVYNAEGQLGITKETTSSSIPERLPYQNGTWSEP